MVRTSAFLPLLCSPRYSQNFKDHFNPSSNSPVFLLFPPRTDFRTEPSSLYPFSLQLLSRHTEKTAEGGAVSSLPTSLSFPSIAFGFTYLPQLAPASPFFSHTSRNRPRSANNSLANTPVPIRNSHESPVPNHGRVLPGWRKLSVSAILSCTHTVVRNSSPITGTRS